MNQHEHNLLVLSDVHLGSDLVQHAQPEAPVRAPASARRRRDLVAFFDFYREHVRGGLPWRLVIAGDFIDFVGMSVLPSVEYQTAPTPEELAHGLGGAFDHTLAKLNLVMRHEAEVMRSLAAFVAAGHSVVIVRGNHDVDWHWEPVQEAFYDSLRGLADFPRERLEFAPWFYYEEGRVFIEHGHQYDAYCSYEHVLHPVSPADPRRTARSLSDILLRYVVRPTRGMTEAGHAAAGAADYVRFALSLGVKGMLRLAQRFLRSTVALVAIWREHLSGAALWVQKEHERKMQGLSRLHQIHVERLRALLALQRPPVTRSLLATLASVMLDRVLLVLSGLVALAALYWFGPQGYRGLAWACGLVLALCAVGYGWRKLRDSLEPSAELRERSARVARLFPAAFVVMGHTHMPETHATDAATYVNLGAWAEDEVADGQTPALPATRTHWVLAQEGGRAVGELLTWDASGPSPFTRQARG